MVVYADAPASVRVKAEGLRALAEAMFVGAGVPAGDAAVVAEALVDAQLRGVASHGMQTLPMYVQALKQGRLNPRPCISMPLEEGPTAVLDGDMGLGHLLGCRAADVAVAKAREYGVGTVLVRRCGHTGALAYYANRCADAAHIGLVLSHGGNVMAPAGGVQRLVGNNPLAYAFPTRRGFPLTLDFALSVAAGAKVFLHKQNGWPVPEGWLLDGRGQPTTDLSDFGLTSDWAGSLAPLGGHKGYALALAHDILCGVLSGGRFGAGLGEPGFGMFVQAVRVEHFLPLDAYYERVDALVDQLKESPLAVGSSAIVVPGERAQARKESGLADGVAVDAGTWQTLTRLAAEQAIPLPEPVAI